MVVTNIRLCNGTFFLTTTINYIFKGGRMKALQKIIVIAMVLLWFGGLTGIVSAQFSRPEDAIKYRKSVMFIIAQHFGRLGDMVKGVKPYEQDKFSSNAALIENLSTLPWEAFLTAGSDKGDTTMKANVLKNTEEFKELSETYQQETIKLVSAAKSNDIDAIKRQFGNVAKSCKACHSKFRK